MKKIAFAIASIATAALPAVAAESYVDRARVVGVQPISERIPVSREECWNDRVRTYEDRSVTRSDTGAAIGPGTVLGAIVGGVAGHQVGSGRGNSAATAAGAVIGGLVGNQVDRSNGAVGPGGPPVTTTESVPVDRNVQRCRTVQEVREANVGYDVRYVFAGREFMTRLDHDPGRFVRVRVNVEAEGGDMAPPQAPPPPPRPPSPTYR
jgi:uncharacterized protein YcfJ